MNENEIESFLTKQIAEFRIKVRIMTIAEILAYLELHRNLSTQEVISFLQSLILKS